MLVLGALDDLDDLSEIYLDRIARESFCGEIGSLKLGGAHAEVFIVLGLKHSFGEQFAAV
jgi:hypothetical protein